MQDQQTIFLRADCISSCLFAPAHAAATRRWVNLSRGEEREELLCSPSRPSPSPSLTRTNISARYHQRAPAACQQSFRSTGLDVICAQSCREKFLHRCRNDIVVHVQIDAKAVGIVSDIRSRSDVPIQKLVVLKPMLALILTLKRRYRFDIDG